MSKKRRTFSADFKSKVALEALREQETLNQIAARYDVLPVQVSQWKNQLLSGASGTFARKGEREKLLEDHSEKESRLYQKIGQLEVELDWLKKKSSQFKR
jgi:transposase